MCVGRCLCTCTPVCICRHIPACVCACACACVCVCVCLCMPVSSTKQSSVSNGRSLVPDSRWIVVSECVCGWGGHVDGALGKAVDPPVRGPRPTPEARTERTHGRAGIRSPQTGPRSPAGRRAHADSSAHPGFSGVRASRSGGNCAQLSGSPARSRRLWSPDLGAT